MKNPTKELMAIPPEDWLEEADRRERAGDKQGAKTARQFARFLMGQKDAFENPASRNAMNSEGLHFIWVLEKDRRAYLHVYKSLQKATTALNTFSKIKRGAIDPSIGRIGSRGISQLGHGIGNFKMPIDGIASEVENKYGVKPEVIRHDLDDGDTNPAHRPKETPLYVKYLSLMRGEEPFMMQGTKYEYVWAEYPGGIKDIGVYSYAGDLVYSYDAFRQMMNLDRTNPVHSRNPKQRIGISLSKNHKRNPVYDTGSDE